MKASSKFWITTVVCFFLLTMLAINAESMWVYDDHGEDIVLNRVDSDEDSPYHEIDEGKYGYYTTSQEWVTVLDFSLTPEIQSPYTWSDVWWTPGSMDADSNGT